MQETPATPEEAEIDRIFAEAVQELDPEKRKVLYDRWQTIVAEQQWLVFTVSPASLTAVRNKFENLNPTAVGGTLHNIHEIFLKIPASSSVPSPVPHAREDGRRYGEVLTSARVPRVSPRPYATVDRAARDH